MKTVSLDTTACQSIILAKDNNMMLCSCFHSPSLSLTSIHSITTSIDQSSPLQNCRAPRQPRPKSRTSNNIPLLNLPAPHRLVQRQRNARRTGISIFVQIRYHLLHRHAQPFRHHLHNSNICLVQEQVIDMVDGHAGLLQRFFYDGGHLAGGEGVDPASVHGH